MAETHIEPYLYHSEVSGWHHHHTEAGALIHLDTASGHFVDVDGTTCIYSSHLADHDELHIPVGPCVDEACSFNGWGDANG